MILQSNSIVTNLSMIHTLMNNVQHMRTSMESLTADVKSGMESLKADVKSEMESLKADVKDVKSEQEKLRFMLDQSAMDSLSGDVKNEMEKFRVMLELLSPVEELEEIKDAIFKLQKNLASNDLGSNVSCKTQGKSAAENSLTYDDPPQQSQVFKRPKVITIDDEDYSTSGASTLNSQFSRRSSSSSNCSSASSHFANNMYELENGNLIFV